MKKAFVLIHFGNNKKYLELEMYLLINLKDNTKNDIIYMYSITDTPESYVKVINDLNIKTIPYDDNNITFNLTYNSHYAHFNTLRTCNFIFAYTLIEYDLICVIESDMIIMDNIDGIFDLNYPAIHCFEAKAHFTNKLIKLKNRKKALRKCNSIRLNGGTLLFKPSLELFKSYKKSIKLIINSDCNYPNEILFIYVNPVFYNMTMTYNFSHYYIKIYERYLPNIGLIYHFNNAQYKAIDIIRDGYIDKLNTKSKKKEIILFFKNKYYDKYHKSIDNIISKLS